MKQLAQGKVAQYPMLTFPFGAGHRPNAAKIGFFGIPGDDASKAGATLWLPGGQYIPKTSKNIEAAKKFVAFVASVPGTEAFSSAVPPTGPYLVKGSTLPANAPPVAKDMQAYIDSKTLYPGAGVPVPGQGPLAGADHASPSRPADLPPGRRGPVRRRT